MTGSRFGALDGGSPASEVRDSGGPGTDRDMVAQFASHTRSDAGTVILPLETSP